MRLTIFILLLSLLGCKNSQKQPFAGSVYFPSVDKLHEGLVWKYYYHQGKIGNGAKTDIKYLKCTLVGDTLRHEEYNAAFQKTYLYNLLVQDEKWISLSEQIITYLNIHTAPHQEIPYTIGQNVHTNWSASEAILERKIVLENGGSRSIGTQSSIRDTMIDGAAAKIIEGLLVILPIRDNVEQDTVIYKRKRIYQNDLGLVASVLRSEEYFYNRQLDELMTLAEFERRANHGMHRVGYIDTLQTLDDHTKFDPCLHPDKINDYYNDRRAEIEGGKGRLRSMLKEKLDSDKINGESGYLTYRFVVNCNGEAGWFVTEEADLDFNRKRFSDSARSHLYELLRAEENWVNLQIRGVDRDAYTYITFKLKDGEIIELLP